MPNQDLRRRAFVADSDYLVDKQNEDEKDPQEDHLDDEEQIHHMLQAFNAASTRNYGHRDDLPPPPKSWKEMMNLMLRWIQGGKEICFKLRKALYGLRKFPKLWHAEFSKTLRNLGLVPVPDEKCLFVHPTKLL